MKHLYDMSSKIVVNCHFFSFAPKKRRERKGRKEKKSFNPVLHTKKMSRDAQQAQFYKPRLEITWGKGLPSETPICLYQILIDIVAHKLYMVQHCCIILSSIVPFVAQLDYFF